MAIKADITFIVPIYGKRISIFIGEDRFEDFVGFCQSKLGEYCPPRKYFTEGSIGLTVSTIIYLAKDDVIGPVVHELYHAVCTIADNAGLEGEEATAYMLGWVVDKYEKEYKKRKAKLSKVINLSK